MLESADDSHGFQPDEAEADLGAQLDRDFPLGDGMADTSATVLCPYCGEVVAVTLDPSGGSAQEYVEDCEVCCQPWSVSVSYRDGHADVSVRPLDA